MRPTVRTFGSRAELSMAAAHHVCDAVKAAASTRGWCALVLAGGSTPQPVYELLARTPFVEDMPWQQVHIFFGDERCVAPDHPDSNFGMACKALLAHVPIPADHVHRMHGEGPADEAARAYEDELRDTFAPGVVRFDLVLLGMGSDGHTASLFPGSPACSESERLVVAVDAPRLTPNVPRITLTLPALNATREVLFLVAGVEKTEMLERVLAGDEALPAARVQPRETLTVLRSET